jgi:hypothetical protein
VPSGRPATLPAGMSANESLESLGALWGLSQGGRALQEGNCPHLGIGIKTFHVTDRGAEEYSVLKIYPLYITFSLLGFPRLP